MVQGPLRPGPYNTWSRRLSNKYCMHVALSGGCFVFQTVRAGHDVSSRQAVRNMLSMYPVVVARDVCLHALCETGNGGQLSLLRGAEGLHYHLHHWCSLMSWCPVRGSCMRQRHNRGVPSIRGLSLLALHGCCNIYCTLPGDMTTFCRHAGWAAACAFPAFLCLPMPLPPGTKMGQLDLPGLTRPARRNDENDYSLICHLELTRIPDRQFLLCAPMLARVQADWAACCKRRLQTDHHLHMQANPMGRQLLPQAAHASVSLRVESWLFLHRVSVCGEIRGYDETIKHGKRSDDESLSTCVHTCE